MDAFCEVSGQGSPLRIVEQERVDPCLAKCIHLRGAAGHSMPASIFWVLFHD